jgi:hypothetical protein
MTLPTKILLALVVVIGGSAYAYADEDVTAKPTDAVNFEPSSPSRGPASITPAAAEDSQAALTLREEIPNQMTEAGSCQIACHPVMTVNPKTALAHFDTEKMK